MIVSGFIWTFQDMEENETEELKASVNAVEFIHSIGK